MGQHKTNPTALAAKRGELPPKERSLVSKREQDRRMYAKIYGLLTLPLVETYLREEQQYYERKGFISVPEFAEKSELQLDDKKEQIMNIISTTDISRTGNDCYIKQTIYLIEFCGLYAVVECSNISGVIGSKDINVVFKSESYDEVVEFYTRNGGILKTT